MFLTSVCNFDRYDLVDLTRQVLSKLANQVYLDAVIAFRQKDVKNFDLHSHKFVQLVKDIDTLLASDDNFLLGTWLESAKKLARNRREMEQVSVVTSLHLHFSCLEPIDLIQLEHTDFVYQNFLFDFLSPYGSCYFNHNSNAKSLNFS